MLYCISAIETYNNPEVDTERYYEKQMEYYSPGDSTYEKNKIKLELLKSRKLEELEKIKDKELVIWSANQEREKERKFRRNQTAIRMDIWRGKLKRDLARRCANGTAWSYKDCE